MCQASSVCKHQSREVFKLRPTFFLGKACCGPSTVFRSSSLPSLCLSCRRSPSPTRQCVTSALEPLSQNTKEPAPSSVVLSSTDSFEVSSNRVPDHQTFLPQQNHPLGPLVLTKAERPLHQVTESCVDTQFTSPPREATTSTVPTCHEVTVVPLAASSTSQLGLSSALQLGSRVSFLPTRRSVSLQTLPRLPGQGSFLAGRRHSYCSWFHSDRKTKVVDSPRCLVDDNSGLYEEHVHNPEHQDDSCKLNDVITTTTTTLLSRDPKVAQQRGYCSHHAETEQHYGSCVGTSNPHVLSPPLSTPLQKQGDDHHNVEAFSVELASLLYRGLSSTVWLCNSDTPLHQSKTAGFPWTSGHDQQQQQQQQQYLSSSLSEEAHSTSSSDVPASEDTFSGHDSASVCLKSLDSTTSNASSRCTGEDVPPPALSFLEASDAPTMPSPCEKCLHRKSTSGSYTYCESCVCVGCTTVRADDKETPVVMKVVHKAKCCAQELIQLSFEAEFLAQMVHPHIIRLLSVVNSETEQWMFFEHAPLGDLNSATMFRVVSEDMCRWITFQILLALHELHSRHSVVHCDVKPHNILLFPDTTLFEKYSLDSTEKNLMVCSNDVMLDKESSWKFIRLKLSDFGLAQRRPAGVQALPFDCLKGTLGYVAPELLLKCPYTEKIDLWALGILAFALMGGYEPFYPVSACLTEPLDFDDRYWSHISLEAKDFLGLLLRISSEERLSALQALQHPWISRYFRVDTFEKS